MSVKNEDAISIQSSGKQFEIKPLPPEDIIGPIRTVGATQEGDIDRFLRYFFEGPFPEKYGSLLNKRRLCTQIMMYYDMGLQFGDFEEPSGDLACVRCDYKCLSLSETGTRSSIFNATMQQNAKTSVPKEKVRLDLKSTRKCTRGYKVTY